MTRGVMFSHAFSRVRRVFAVATVLGAVASAICIAAPAYADATATVKARTQRMSDANLSSQQNGWYNEGDKLTLVCAKRGQAVKGFFSFNIPGGWDDLWYRTSDGSYVADVDIETGTLDSVAPGCDAEAPQPAPPAQSGGLRVPLDGSPGINRGFGNGHNGIDYQAKSNTPVYAADAGTVTFEGWGHNNSWMTGMAGICVLLRHGDKYTGYAHLSSTVINTGSQVSKGQLIGYTGATGTVTGPHLHFEVLPLNPDFNNGYAGRVDPAPFL